jgi:hypothetical protein
MKKTTTLLVGTAVAGLLAAGMAMADHHEGKGKKAKKGKAAKEVACYGVNECKGHSVCKTSKHECKGHNECKGQGVMKMSEKDCKDKGGSLTEPS